MTAMDLQEEYFRMEGSVVGMRAWAYVTDLIETRPELTRDERKALLYLALYELDGITRPSVAALSMVVDRGQRDTRELLVGLIEKGILRSLLPNEAWKHDDEHVYEFVGMRGR